MNVEFIYDDPYNNEINMDDYVEHVFLNQEWYIGKTEKGAL